MKILSSIQSGQVNCVIALKLDRLFRNVVDALTTTETWNKKGISLHIVDMGGQSIDTSSAMGKMFMTMMAGFAEFERGLISERTSAALQHKKRNNNIYGKVPFGKKQVDKKLIDDISEMNAIDDIISMRMAGKSLLQITKNLNNRNFGRIFYPSTIQCILKTNNLTIKN
jgi:DNA invertase Pin-like site-specific DNA recombinase